MSNQYRLLELGNSELLAGLSELVRQSHVLSARVLAHLAELEARMLHLERGFSSLFSYCVEALGMSEGAAGRRVTAARVCRRFPEAFERIARGELHLCALCALASHLNPENAASLFEACRGKTRRQVEELLAVRFPRPDVREQIRRLPVRAPARVEAVRPFEAAGQTSLPGRTAAGPVSPAIEAEVPRIQPGPVLHPAGASGSDARRRARELEPLSADRFGVHFTADAELRDLIERARGLASHRLPNGDLAALMKLMAASFVRQEEKRRFGIGARKRRAETRTTPVQTTPVQTTPVQTTPVQTTPVQTTAVQTTAVQTTAVQTTAVQTTARSTERKAPPGGVEASPKATKATKREVHVMPSGKRGRYVPVGVRREAHARDLGQCAFVSADGRRCNARVFLEFDHVRPFARFGAADTLNIRLLCKAHNLWHARHCFGARHVAAKIAARKRSDAAT